MGLAEGVSVRVMGRGVAEYIGRTPLVRLKSFEKPGVKVFAKCEMFNPGGSIKDRPALYIMLEAERKGLLKGDKVLLDATSGNTGVAYAMLGAVMGYRVKLVSPSNISRQKLTKIKSFGAEVVLTEALEGMDGAIKKARELYEQEPHKYYYADQYSNPANPLAHYETTGPEIWAQTNGQVTHVVAGVGTSGTLQGISRFMKEKNPGIVMVEVQPESEFHGIEGLKYMKSALRPELYGEEYADMRFFIKTEDAVQAMKALHRKEGVLAGSSGGAALAAASSLVEGLQSGVVVVILPDGYTNQLPETR